MGEREMFLVLASLFFFSVTSLSVNRFCLNNSEIIMQGEYEKFAISLAQRFIEEAKTRAFDAASESGSTANPPSDFTYPLGPRWNEYYPVFTDVDDFHRLSLQVPTDKATYNVYVTVGYVYENDPDVVITSKTYHKKMTVTVSSSVLPQDIVLSHVYSYYEF